MRLRRLLALSLTAVLAALLALTTASPADAAGSARIRVIHNFFNDTIGRPATVDIRVGKASKPAEQLPVAATVSYGDITPYLAVRSGNYKVAVFAAGTNVKIAEFTKRLTWGSYTTVVARPVSNTDKSFTVDVLSDNYRNSKRGFADVRVIHGIPADAANGVRIGAVGVGCLLGPVSFPGNAKIKVPAGTFTVGVFAPSDTNCSGAPLPGLSAQLTFESRKAYTAIAQFDTSGSGFRLNAAFDRAYH